MSAQDDRTARLVINLGAVSNVSLAVFKAGAGALTGSASLLADAGECSVEEAHPRVPCVVTPHPHPPPPPSSQCTASRTSRATA